MPMLSTPPRSLANLAATALHQIHITHCLHGEGRYGTAGFNVWACSTDDPLLLRFALEYPAYDLPAGAPAGGLAPEAAPRRLALVRIPGGRSALLQSVYLPEDRGRSNNFFSHVLVAPALEVRAALAAWASTGWATRPGPEGRAVRDEGRGSPTLEPLAALPPPGPLDDAAVTAFLRPITDDQDQDLATLTCPQRLAGAPQRRRELLRLVLRGCQLALGAGPTAARSRFYIAAEPGLVALLLYAATRLLPQALAADLTFSTYEHPRRDLRSYRQARVVGTYPADSEKGLDEEFFTARGYALDTFGHRYSPELAAGGPEVEEWIDLAARGDWATVDLVQERLGKQNAAVFSLSEALEATRVAGRLASGQVQASDLLALQHAPWAPAILAEYRDQVWPLVREASRSDPAVCEAFAPLLREHQGELELRTAQALRTGGPADWQPHWRLLRAVLQGEPGQLWVAFNRVLPEPPYPPALRLALLSELHTLGLPKLHRKLRFHPLLRTCAAADLDLLARSDLPREWFVWALCYALLRPQPLPEAVAYLHGGDDALLRTFWGQFQHLLQEDQRRTLLAPLFPPSEDGLHFLVRLLKNRCRFRPETLHWLLDSLGAFRKDRMPFWTTGDPLSHLLDALRRAGAGAEPLWDQLCAQIGRAVLVPGESYQRVLLMELAAASGRPGPAVPRRAARAIADWVLLREHFERAAGVPRAARRAVIAACNHRGLDPIEVLAGYFEQFILPHGVDLDVLDDFVGFFHSFYLEEGDYQASASRLLAWLRIVAACPDEGERAAYQLHYLEHHVALEYRWRLADEVFQAGKLLPAVYDIVPRLTEPARGWDTAGAVTDRHVGVFQLTGVGPPGAAAGSWPTFRRRFPWLVPSLAGGLLAALLCRLGQEPLHRVAGLVLFLPAVYALAESVAGQSVALMVRRRQPAAWAEWRRLLGREVLAGLFLAVPCVLVLGGLAAGVGGGGLVLGLGVAVFAALAGAAALGLVLTLLVRRLRWEALIPAGVLARPLAGVAALALYLGIARWLLG